MFLPKQIILVLAFFWLVVDDVVSQSFVNEYNISRPNKRYKLFRDVRGPNKALVVQIGYDRTSWENPPFLDIENSALADVRIVYGNATYNAILEFGLTEDQWDCYINHFEGYAWSDLVTFEIVDPLITLGWTAELWVETDSSLWPASSFKSWAELSDIEKQAVANLCYFEETWDALPFSEWITPPSGQFCFPGSAEVDVKDNGQFSLQDVQLGDEILVEKDRYETVYSFGHYDRLATHKFVQIHSFDNQGTTSSLKLSSNHLVQDAVTKKFVPASTLQAGDSLIGKDGNHMSVVKVGTSLEQGAFAPFTASGKLIVDGISVSSFVTLQDDEANLKIGPFSVSHQWIAHSFEFPHRFYCQFISRCTKETYDEDGISSWVAAPRKFFLWLLEQNDAIVGAFMAVFLLILTGFSTLSLLMTSSIKVFGTILVVAIVATVKAYLVKAGKKTLL